MMDANKNTGLPQLHSSHLWLLGIGSTHRWPHHGTSPRLACKTKYRVSSTLKGLVYRGRYPFKCTKTGMVNEAEEPINQTKVTHDMTVRCVTHHGHCLDGTRLVASQRGKDWAPTLYIP